MIENEKYVNNIIIKVIILLIVESIILLIFFDNVLPKILGLLLGGLVSIAFFRILYLNIVSAIEKTEVQAKKVHGYKLFSKIFDFRDNIFYCS